MKSKNSISIIENNKISFLKIAIKEGIESGINKNFNPKKHLEFLKSQKIKNEPQSKINTTIHRSKKL